MAQIVPRDSIGERFGTGLGQGLESYAKYKLKQLGDREQNAQFAQALSSILGGGEEGQQAPKITNINPQQAMSLATLAQTAETRKEMRELKKQKQQEDIDVKRKALEEKHQARVDLRNKPYLEKWDETGNLGQRVADDIDKALAHLDSGVKSGLLGKYTPDVLLDKNSQEFNALTTGIIPLLANLTGDSAATNQVRESLTKAKANLSQKPETMRNLLLKTKKEALRFVRRKKIALDMIAENDDKQPENLQSLVFKREKDLDKEEARNERLIKSGKNPLFSKLPDAAEHPGQLTVDKDLGKTFRSIDGDWVEVEKVQGQNGQYEWVPV